MTHTPIRRAGGVAGASGMLALAIFVPGCAYPNQFHNVPAASPHAVLTVAPSRLFAAHPKVGSINEQPTSFWRCGETFQIPPGPTVVRAIYGEWDPHTYAPLQFTAVGGHRYMLRREFHDRRDGITAWESAPAGEPDHVVARGDRQ